VNDPRSRSRRGVAVSIGVALGFLAFAALISSLAPVVVLVLERDDGEAVRAEVTEQLWFVVPHRARILRGVERVATRNVQQAAYQEPTRPGGFEAHAITPEQEGVLILSGPTGSLEASVSPADLDSTARRVNGFLTGSDRRLRLWLVSNWKVAVIVQSIVLLPALLIALGLARDLARKRR